MSIGPAGDIDQSGSLGFYLKVEYEGSIDVLAITCHHVVTPDNEAPVCLLAPITMESPSQADHNAWTAALTLAIQDSTVINGFYTAMQGTTASPGQIDDKLTTAGMSDELRLRTAQNFSRNTGLVHISSGMTDVLCGRRLDWALVGLTGSRFASGQQSLSNKPPTHLLEYLHAQRYNPRKAAERGIVFKVGRTTGPTIGYSSRYRAVLQVFHQDKTVRTIENIITSYSGDQCFARAGDSGAPVYGAHGDAQFTVWGGLEQLRENGALVVEHVVFATPIQVILHDVVAKLSQAIGHTNFKVTLA